jgi:acyl-CoA thioester hydrolase
MPHSISWIDRLRVERLVWTLDQRLYDGDEVVARCECVLVAYDYDRAKPRPLDDDERAFWQGYA